MRRDFRDLDDSIELGTRNIKVALKRLRRWVRDGAEQERAARSYRECSGASCPAGMSHVAEASASYARHTTSRDRGPPHAWAWAFGLRPSACGNLQLNQLRVATSLYRGWCLFALRAQANAAQRSEESRLSGKQAGATRGKACSSLAG